jgi:hypothetical protein
MIKPVKLINIAIPAPMNKKSSTSPDDLFTLLPLVYYLELKNHQALYNI